MSNGSPQSKTNTQVLEREETEIALPKMWSVTFHNDDVTGFDFVMFILMKVFKKTAEQSFEFAKDVHENGKGVAGTYPYEMAEEKYEQALTLIRANQQNLRITLDEE